MVVDGGLVGQGWIDADESLLTGECDLVRKRAGDPVSSGSFCVNGSAVYEAEQVGAQSTAYKLTAGARIFRRGPTPPQQQGPPTLPGLLIVARLLCLAPLVITARRQDLLVATGAKTGLIAGQGPHGLSLAR